MSLFIRPENQNILWDTLHKTHEISSVFPPGSPIEPKNEWFKKHIETKYRQIPKSISKEELYKINREVLANMITELRGMFFPIAPMSIDAGPSYTRLSNKSGISTNYELREAQYKQLFDTPKPNPIDFTEKFDDEAITNMEELIQRHKQTREKDLQLFGAPSQTSTSALPPVPAATTDKRVRFNTDTTVTSIPVLSSNTEYTEILKKIENMDKKIENMDKKMEELYSFIKQIIQEKHDAITTIHSE